MTVAAFTATDDLTPLEHALCDGEDFELTFCVDESDADRLRRDPLPDVTLHEIGEITVEPGVAVLDAHRRSMTFTSTGWKHRW